MQRSRALCKKTMERFLTKKESGAGERKRRKLEEEEEAEKSIKFSMPCFAKPGTSSLTHSVESPVSDTTEVIEQSDIGLLKFNRDTGKVILHDTLRTEIIKLSSKYFQNSEGPFLPTNNRSMNKTWFKRKLHNGEEVPRSWLVYSPSKKSAFCFCCLLFSQSDHQSSLEQESGFNQWKAPERITVHENAKNHRKCFLQWKVMERNLAENSGVNDTPVQSQIEKEKQKWHDILMTILHCIKILVTENLPLQGYGESLQLEDYSRVGDFLGLLKLVANFDPVMKEYLTHVESHPGSISYLSPDAQNEFIHMMASAVRQNLLRRIREEKYYGLIFSTTSDQAHCEQLSEVVRYAEVDSKNKIVRVRESFLGFIHVSQKDAESLVEVILKQLEKDEMELQYCRSQSYNNTAVMAGHISGVHQRLSEKNNLAVFVDCNNHSLNLVGVHAAEQDTTMVTFFGNIEAFYVFFSSSTQCWEKLKNAVPVVVKSESETRWSARTEAVGAVNTYLEEILQVLQDIEDDENETSATRSDAMQLYNCMMSYDFLILLGFWNKVLVCIDRVQNSLQDPSINFHDAALHLKTLRDHFGEEREALVSESLEEGLGLCQKVGRHQRRKRRMADKNSTDAGLTGKEMEGVMKGTLGHLHREMDERFIRLHDTDTKFGFLFDIKGLCYGTDRNNLKRKCEKLGQLYSCDINGRDLYQEILDCRMLLSGRPKVSRPEELLKFITEYGHKSVFPYLCAAIQIMLPIAVSITSRSSSKLKLILSYLRGSVSQGSLCDLALLSVEREETEKTDFDHIIDHFATMEAKKRPGTRYPLAHPRPCLTNSWKRPRSALSSSLRPPLVLSGFLQSAFDQPMALQHQASLNPVPELQKVSLQHHMVPKVIKAPLITWGGVEATTLQARQLLQTSGTKETPEHLCAAIFAVITANSAGTPSS